MRIAYLTCAVNFRRSIFLMAQLPSITFAPLSHEAHSKTLVVFMAEGGERSPRVENLERKSNGTLSKAIEVASFKGKRKSVVEILAPANLAASRLLIVGVGDAKSLTARDWMDIGGAVRGKLSSKTTDADVLFDELDGVSEDAPLSFALGFSLRSYSFKKYKSKKAAKPEGEESNSSDDAEIVPQLTIMSKAGAELNNQYGKKRCNCPWCKSRARSCE